MTNYSDNQTGHLYVLGNNTSTDNTWVADGTDVVIGRTIDNKFNIQIKHGGVIDEVTDQIDSRHILNVKATAVDPVYYRRWKVNPMASLVGNTKYSLYFYLENTIGFGINDRTDIAVSYDATDSTVNDGNHDADDAALIKKAMSALKDKLNAAINTKGYGSIVGDFIVTMLDGSLSVADATTIFGVTPTTSTTSTGSESLSKTNGTGTTKTYTLVKIVGTTETTYKFTNSPVNIDINDNCIYVYENKNSDTYKHTDNEIMIGAHPYEYDLTLSTYENYNNATWGTGNGRRIYAENTSTVRFGSGVIVKDMENFFMRNRADLYSLSPNFNASIINNPIADTSKNYSIVNVHYAFSDNLGFSYLSEKDLNIAVVEASAGSTTNGAKIVTAINAKKA